MFLFLTVFVFYSNAAFPNSWSNRLVILSGWLAFLLVHAYYSGALTMFLSSESAPPFERAWDGLKLYPEWKMVSYPGGEIVIQPLGMTWLLQFPRAKIFIATLIYLAKIRAGYACCVA